MKKYVKKTNQLIYIVFQQIRELHPSRVLVIGFAATILIGALLLNLPVASKSGEAVGFVNALFISTSAVCVTGLVVVDTATQWTLFGKTVILSLIQIGGLGFMTMGTFMALILGRKISLKERLIIQESLNQFNISGLIKLSKYILIMTLIIEGVGALLLSTRFIPEYGFIKGIGYSVFHSISAFCNAGFDLVGEFRSLTPYVHDPVITLTVAVLIILGGIGFVVILEVIEKKRFSKFSLHTKLVLTITAVLLASSFILFFILEYSNPSTIGEYTLGEKALAIIFQAVTPRTAGFNTIAIDQLRISSIFLTIMLMFIGGASGGTAGGVKITTVGVVLASIHAVIRGKSDIQIYKRRISRDIIDKSIAIVGISILLVVAVTMILSISEPGHRFDELFFETVSAFGTVGLSMGITPTLTIIGKIIITLLMFFGRVGPLTIFVAMAKKQEYYPKCRYPKENVIVG